MGDRIVFEKGALKIPTHKGRTVDIRRIWNANIKVIPVKTGATGTISKTFTQYLSDIPGN